MTARHTRFKMLIGTCVLAALGIGLGVLAASPTVAQPMRRIVSSITSVFDTSREGDVSFEVQTAKGLSEGLPVYLVSDGDRPQAIAHVRRFEALSEGRARVHLRFAPDADTRGPWRLVMYTPSKKLGAALDMAVTPEAAERFSTEIAGRIERLWAESILPEAEKNFPAFVKRIDPTRDTQAKALLSKISSGLITSMQPFLDDLTRYVAWRVEGKLDVWDKLGLGVKFISGDEKGILKKLMPTVESAARDWWTNNETKVVRNVGAVIRAHAGELQTWAGGELFAAAREELVQPILASQRKRLESEGEALLRYAADEFIQAPGGGFRVRFAALLRTQLLDKKTALLLLERER